MGEKEGFMPFQKGFETVCIHSGIDPNLWKSKAVIPHIVPSTVFQLGDPRQPSKYIYGRMGNPSRSLLEKTCAAINKAKYGLCFASGVSAVTAVLSALRPGDHMVCCDDVSPGTYEVFTNIASNYKISTTFLDFDDAAKVCSAIKEDTKLLWVEYPTNTTLKVIDLCTMVNIAREKKVLLGVDNTYLTPYLQRPLEFGADIVMQSLTKYMNGHSDCLMGTLCTNKSEIFDELLLMQTIGGLVPAPFDCYQALRGLKTLNLRMDQHMRNSTILANYLGQHRAVKKVIHPGLKNHPQHEVFKRQSSGHSGIISLYLDGGLENAKRFLGGLKVFTVADVPGGNESTAQLPFVMSHKGWTKERKQKLHITENLVKLSVGLENICDLLFDIESALDSLKPPKDSKNKCS